MPKLALRVICLTLSYTERMQNLLTVRLSATESQSLDWMCEISGKSRSEVVRESLRSHRLSQSLRQSQALLAPIARSAGWLTEDELLSEIDR